MWKWSLCRYNRVKMTSHWVPRPYCDLCYPPKKREIRTQTLREGPRDNKERNGVMHPQIKECPGWPRATARRCKRLEVPSPQGAGPPPRLDPWLTPSRTVGPGLHFCCFKSPVCGAVLWRVAVASLSARPSVVQAGPLLPWEWVRKEELWTGQQASGCLTI